MQNWQDIYRSRVMSDQEAVNHIKSGDRVVIAHGPGAPMPIIEAMVSNKDAYQNVEVSHLVTFGGTPYVGVGMEGHLRLNSMFIAGTYRGALEQGNIDFTPVHFSNAPALYQGKCKADVVLATVSKPDDHGFVSFGLNCDYTIPAAKVARTIIVEVNENCPRVFGQTFMHVSEIECFVERNHPMTEVPLTVQTDIEKKIGGHCAELIEDGATLQMGIGSIPDAVLPYLMEKKDLGIHSEIIADGVQLLMEAGVINGSRKTLHKGVAISTSLFGTRNFHRFADNNPQIALYPVNYTNDVQVIAQNKKMVSINSCVEVDLTGQVCSESLGYKQFSGVGGQLDFVRGAQMSEDGKSIIACYSTAKNDTISKIVPMLSEGTAVTVPRTDVDFVVTEYGVAALRGCTLMERAKALISIAHPKFRDELMEAVERRYKRKIN